MLASIFENIEDTAAQAEKSPFVATSSHTEELVPESQGSQPKRSEGAPTGQLIEELCLAAAHQAALVAQLQAKYASDCSSAVQRDEENARLREPVVEARMLRWLRLARMREALLMINYPCWLRLLKSVLSLRITRPTAFGCCIT